MNRNVCFILIVTLAAQGWRELPTATAAESPEGEKLTAGFLDPPPEARPAAYWAWLNGVVDRAQLTRELEQMKAAGVSKYYIFECGAQDPEKIVPPGPAFMGPESVDAISYAIREAGRVGMELGFTTSSSWNCGGTWVEPKHASMGLFQSEVKVEGPARFRRKLPFPKVPAKAPRDADGMPRFYRDVAVLAVPESDQTPGYEFVIELASPGPHTIERVVLYNTETDTPDRLGPMRRFTKDFTVSVSTTAPDAESFEEVVRGALEPKIGPQEFRFDPVKARYLRLTILSGHNPREKRVELGEFEAYTSAGKNIALKYFADGSGGGANLLRYSSAATKSGDWSAGNIYDRAKSGPGGSWRSGTPPMVIDDINSVIDLTDQIDADGKLDWNVPPGRWTIMRMLCANTGQGLAIPSPNSHGLAIDHFSADATRMHFQYLIDKLQAKLGPLRETALTTMYVCSYELRGAAWTPDFLDQFQKRRGYDMARYLPVLFGSTLKNRRIAERFEFDYRKTQGDLLVDAFYKSARDISHEYGMLLCAEAGGPGPPTHNVPVDALKAQGVMDIPRGEFWTDLHLWVVKETACASHVYGKGIVDMEAFTSWQHWQNGPFELKPFADRAMCDGTNHFTFHTSPHVPPEAGTPGWVYHAGTHMGPSLAWWPKAKPFIDYLSRCSYLLQQGLFVGDVCYYYGDQAYNFVPPKHVDPSLGPGYDYDVANTEVILTRMDVQNGRIVLPDRMSYELLVLPDREDINPDVLVKLEKMVRAGATIVGRKPTRSNGLADFRRRDARVKALADKLWGPCDGQNVTEHFHGKGRVVWGRPLRDILQERGIGPDFEFSASPDANLDYIHRRVGDTEIYFIANRTQRWEDVECRFRVSGKAPELWDADTGEVRHLAVYREEAGATVVPLRLAPAESVFIVFRQESNRRHLVAETPEEAWELSLVGDDQIQLVAFREGVRRLETDRGDVVSVDVPAVPAPQPVAGPWTVRFPEGWGAPPQIELAELISWTEHADEGVKYFSGIATYETEFDVSENLLGVERRLFLDLGRVGKIADVTLNGRPLATLWRPPFQLDITETVKSGKNRLVVEVANTWSNRLVGDANSSDGKKYCNTNIRKSLTWKVPWKETPLQESGLLGPVRLIPARRKMVKLP